MYKTHGQRTVNLEYSKFPGGEVTLINKIDIKEACGFFIKLHLTQTGFYVLVRLWYG